MVTNVVFMTSYMVDNLEQLVDHCNHNAYFGDNAIAVNGNRIGRAIGDDRSGLWIMSDDEINALLCAIDCCSDNDDDHFWDSKHKLVFSDSGKNYGLQYIVDRYLNCCEHLPAVFNN